MSDVIRLCILCLALAACGPRSVVDLSTESLDLAILDDGSLGSLSDARDGHDYLVRDVPAPLLSIRKEGEFLHPTGASFQFAGTPLEPDATHIDLDPSTDAHVAGTVMLTYEDGSEALVWVTSKDTHITFELYAVSGPGVVEVAVWGPYPSTIDETIGETVGVVRGRSFAIGIQSLNEKTLGGYPWAENDCMPQIDIFEQEDPPDPTREGGRHVLYRVEAARPTEHGSALQAYCRNRAEERVIENWNHESYVAPAFDDGGVLGCKIALFGSPVEGALEAIGAIELAEGLPHPMIDGKWGKTALSASAAYVIMPFSEEDIDYALDVTRRAGLRYLYHPDPFETWGHFLLRSDHFPSGLAGMREVVRRAEERGVMLGVHTLSNFITTDDPYVTPVPDPRLARVGSSVLTSDIGPTDAEIPIESPLFFRQEEQNHLKTVVVGGELVQYAGVSDEAPWRLLDVRRGAFGTTAVSHRAGDDVGKLADHAYRVFLTNPELSIEVSRNIADLFARTGLRQISFDGMEGNRSTGLGNYGEVLFAKTWFDNLSEEVRSHYIADASRSGHYFWHIYTRMNWGEPWYAGFRESQTEYRLKNQAYFRRNMMPGMLGWFRMTSGTSVEDIEWMLARSAAFDAGYSFVTNRQALEENGHSDEILRLLGLWEEARLSGAFGEALKKEMEDIANEFRLEAVEEGEWDVYRVHSFKHRHERRERQPGEPTHSVFDFWNPPGADGSAPPARTVGLIITAAGGDVEDLELQIDGIRRVSSPLTLRAGQTLKYVSGHLATVFDAGWHRLHDVEVDASALTVSGGEHTLTVDGAFVSGDEPHVKVEIRIMEEAERIRARLTSPDSPHRGST